LSGAPPSADFGLRQFSPADLDIPISRQLAPAQLPLGDALEPGPLKEESLDAALGGGPSGSRRWNTRCVAGRSCSSPPVASLDP
jgi:hypothetical protein